MSNNLNGADIWGNSNNVAGGSKAGGGGGSSSSSGNKIDKPTSGGGSGEGGGKESKQDDPPPAAAADDDMINDKTSMMSIAELWQHIQLINNEICIFHSNIQRINHKGQEQWAHNRENIEKGKLNKQLPYLLGNVVEVPEPKAEDGLDDKDDKEDGATDVDAQHKTRSAVIHTLMQQTIYLSTSQCQDLWMRRS